MRLDEESFLADLLECYSQDPSEVPEGFEVNFLCDIAERFKNEGSRMFMSGAMMNIIRRIGYQRYGLDWFDYKDE